MLSVEEMAMSIKAERTDLKKATVVEFALVLDLANKECGNSEQSDVTARYNKLSSSEEGLAQKKEVAMQDCWTKILSLGGRCRERGTRRVFERGGVVGGFSWFFKFF